MRIPSSREVHEAVEAMTAIPVVGRKLVAVERCGYRAAAAHVQSAGPEVLSIAKIHSLLNPHRKDAGVVHPRSEVTEGIKRFYCTYSKALQWRLSDEPERYRATVDWYVAAFGRCIKPFAYGSAAVFYLVENHLLQVHGLPWRIALMSQEFFETFRATSFRRTFGHLVL
jgi:hypothetical protein